MLAGELLTYTLTAQNAGPSSATGVSVTDTLPAGVDLRLGHASQGTCSESGGTVTCALGTIADGRPTPRVEIKVRAVAPGTITNQAGVASDAGDPSRSNNSASAETTVDPAADLSLTKSRLARPGARRAAADLHPHGAQRRARRTPPA